MASQQDIEQAIDRICMKYDEPGILKATTAYPDGADTGPMFPRLQRAAGNQLDQGAAMFSRYGIWANTIRGHLAAVLEVEELTEENRNKLTAVHNSLSAFIEIQALFDPLRD
ncbi:MAG: hypothetical protein ABW079_17600 [Sedimenticola sp.]